MIFLGHPVDFAAAVRHRLGNTTTEEVTMQHMLLIYSDEQAVGAMSEAEGEAMMREYGQFSQEARDSGVLVDGQRLRPTPTATTVRVRDGETLTTDGPFAETKEQFGGYYIVEAETLDEALAWAAKIPGARVGSIEVRPVWEMAPAEAGA
jgi:hypothetical protein